MPVYARNATKIWNRPISSEVPVTGETYVYNGTMFVPAEVYNEGDTVPIADGGTSAQDAAAARTALGVDAAITAEVGSLLTASPDFLHSYMFLYDDFIGNTATNGAIGSLGWSTGGAAAGGAASVPLAAVANSPGYVSLATGTTNNNTGVAEINLSIVTLQAQPDFIMEWRIRTGSALASATPTYNVRFGLMNSNDATATTDGYWFSYNNSDDNIHCNTGDADTGTSSNTVLTTYQVSTSYTCRCVVSNGTASYSVNGGTAVDHTLHLPDSGDTFGPSAIINKVGTSATSRTFNIDYFYLRWAVTR